MTPERILQITRSRGEFQLTWHYRVDHIRNTCRKLVKQGLLKRIRSNRGLDVWVPTPPPEEKVTNRRKEEDGTNQS